MPDFFVDDSVLPGLNKWYRINCDTLPMQATTRLGAMFDVEIIGQAMIN